LINILKTNIMELIREPLDVDFFVYPRPLTVQEKKMISDFIRADKEKRKSEKLLEDARTPNNVSYEK